MPPKTATDWLNIREQRAADAGALRAAERYHGAVYLAGYAVEASAKALCLLSGRQPPTSGRLGHSLSYILLQAGIRLNDLHGEERAFVTEYSVHMRYELALPMSLEPRQAYFAASSLSSKLDKRARRASRRSRRRKQ